MTGKGFDLTFSPISSRVSFFFPVLLLFNDCNHFGMINIEILIMNHDYDCDYPPIFMFPFDSIELNFFFLSFFLSWFLVLCSFFFCAPSFDIFDIFDVFVSIFNV